MGIFNPKALIRRIDTPGQPDAKRYEAHFENEPYFAYGATEQEAAANLWRYYERRDAAPTANESLINGRMAAMGKVAL